MICALTPKADIDRQFGNVRLVPIADIRAVAETGLKDRRLTTSALGRERTSGGVDVPASRISGRSDSPARQILSQQNINIQSGAAPEIRCMRL